MYHIPNISALVIQSLFSTLTTYAFSLVFPHTNESYAIFMRFMTCGTDLGATTIRKLEKGHRTTDSIDYAVIQKGNR